MPQNGEQDTGSAKLEALRQETAGQTIEQIKEEFDLVLAKAVEVQTAVQHSVRREGRVNIGDHREEAKEVKQTIQKVIMAVAEGISSSSAEDVNRAIPEFARNVIQKLSQQLKPAELTDTSSPFIYDIVRKVVSGEVTDIESLQAAYEEVKPLIDSASHVSGEKVQESLMNVAREIVGEERAREMFQASEDARRGREGVDPEAAGVDEGAFGQIWDTYYSPFLSPEDRNLVRAMYMPDRFQTEVIAKEWALAAEHYREHHHKGNEELTPHDLEEINKHMSEEIELKMSLVVSKLFRTVDRNDPEEEFSHLITAGGYATPSTANTFLRGKIGELASYFEQRPESSITDPADNRQYKVEFYRRFVDEDMRPREYKGKTIIARKTIPSMRPESLSEFLTGVNNNVEHEFKWREYTHNIGVIFSQANVGEGGFWSKMAGYADRISSSDIDNIMHLPDSDLFMEAYRLYIRYLEQDFAINNWIHQADTFDKKVGRWTAIQEKVMESLREIHRNKQGHGEETQEQESWRIQRAMSIATGFARGLFLSETEMAAFADPQLNPDGTITFKRYYTDDNVALRVLNPLHHIYRFQLTATQHYPILYWPVSETKSVHMFRHRREWEKGQQFRASFLEGTQALKKGHENEKSIMEMLPNFSHAASFMSRPGWRLGDSYKQWMVYKEGDGIQTSNIDFLKTWKSIENIGYQVVFDFALNSIEDAGGLNIGKNREFYEYIFKKYVNPEGDLDAEIKNLRPQAKKDVEEFIKKGIAYKYERRELTEQEIARVIVHKAMAGMLRQRLPSKFLMLERDRLVQDGQRPWEKMRLAMKSKGIELGEYNDLLEQLIVVENEVRKETTEGMKKHLESNQRDIMNVNFSEFNPEHAYRVDEDSIRRIMQKHIANRRDLDEPERAKREQRVEKVVDLYRMIMKENGDDKALAQWGEKMRWRDVRGKILKARHFAFAVAQEETETQFLSFINTGPKMLQNTFTEISMGEDAFKGLQEWVDSLKKVATDGKRDFGPIIEAINKVKGPISGIENSDYATKWAFYLAQASVAFFRKDSFTKMAGVRYTSAGQVRSMAGEVVGPGRNAWEWDTEDQHKFYYQLEASGILPKTAQTFKDVFQEKAYDKTVNIPFARDVNIERIIKLPFMKGGIPIKIQNGQLSLGKKVEKIRHTSYTSDLARQLSGSSGKEIILEIINKYLPIAIAAILMNFIIRAMKESQEKKS